MLAGVWGRKIGMSQIFADKAVIPVTVVELDHWVVIGIKTKERDGYDAVQVGNIRKRYIGQEFSPEWIKKPKVYFSMIREIKYTEMPEEPYKIGQFIGATPLLSVGDYVDIVGITKGKGFQGVVKRYGFRGGSASHGPRFGRWPGAISFMRRQGRVVKGKKLPGHMGVDQRMMKNLEVVHIDQDGAIALVKGSVPGSAGSWLYMKKAR